MKDGDRLYADLLRRHTTTDLDAESARPFCRGAIVRDLAGAASNYRSTQDLEDYLVAHSLAALTGVDTRRLTRHLRQAGTICGAFGPASHDELAAAAQAATGTDDQDLASLVTTATRYELEGGPHHLVVVDFGVKTTMLRQLQGLGRLTVVPAGTSAAAIRDLSPDGVFLSNGPGDPAALDGPVATIAELLGEVPIFGICLGHQLLARALGGVTYKLAFGHHGGNHPVLDLATGHVEITSQNHNYAVARDGLGSATITHVNLNDQVVEGLMAASQQAFSVQYHPEAGPGPHDARYLFDRFRSLIEGAPLAAP